MLLSYVADMHARAHALVHQCCFGVHVKQQIALKFHGSPTDFRNRPLEMPLLSLHARLTCLIVGFIHGLIHILKHANHA